MSTETTPPNRHDNCEIEEIPVHTLSVDLTLDTDISNNDSSSDEDAPAIVPSARITSTFLNLQSSDDGTSDEAAPPVPTTRTSPRSLMIYSSGNGSSDEDSPPHPPTCTPRRSIIIYSSDNDSSEEDAPTVPPVRTPPRSHTIYIPSFLDVIPVTPLPLSQLNIHLLKKNWLTPDLVCEIERCFPTKAQITISADGDNVRDPQAFKVQATRLMPPGRIFASFKQLDQVAKLFLDAWGIQKIHTTKRIGCFYGKPCNKKSRLHEDPAKRRRVVISPKKVYQCPFEIRYSFIDYCNNTESKKPNIFYRVKVTKVNLEHTCQLSTIFHRETKQKNGSHQPDLNGLTDIISLLREKPNLKPEFLRPLLLKYLPYYKSIDARFITNFRQRAIHWIIHQKDRDFSMEDARHVSSTARVAADEYVVREDPQSTQVLTSLLRKVMQEDGCTWEAISYLQELKKPNPGMDYRIKLDPYGRPEALCYILPEMRQDLLRFGEALFLDSQKRQFNSMNWPYIGPCIKDQEMKVRVVTESICVEESTRMYRWVLEMMHDMEPRFSLNNIRLIFGDKGITLTLLESLGIDRTCLLRGDYHHLINEVFPEQFGIHKFTLISGHLSTMLLGSRNEWDNSYTSAKQHLQGDAEKVSLLNSIHENPHYYAGWYLRKIPGNLMVNGSVAAEQNHASVVAHLGKGANWGVAEHISHMLKRQIHLTTLRRQKENSRFVLTHRYKSKLGMEDQTAKKSLSAFAYDNLFTTDLRRSKRLQHLSLEDGTVNIWPCGQMMDCEKLVSIQPGARCNCLRRIAFDHQCCHELCSEGGIFDMKRFGLRWLNDKTFQQVHPNFWLPAHLPAFTNTEVGVETDDLVVNDDDRSISEKQGANFHDAADSDSDNELVPHSTANLTYPALIQQFEVLARLVQSDRNSMASVSKMIQTVTARARNGMSIAAHFDTTLGSAVLMKDAHRTPVRGTLFVTPTASVHNRMKSRQEKRRGCFGRKKAPASNNVAPRMVDVDHYSDQRQKSGPEWMWRMHLVKTITISQ